MSYSAPLAEMRFVLNEVAGLEQLAGYPDYEDATPDLVDAILSEAGKLAGEVFAPLNHSGDRTGSVFENGVVRTPNGFQDAYNQYVEGGWNSLPFDPDYGGQGLPWTLAMATQEMWQAANMSLSLCPLLTFGTVELLQEHASPEQKDLYLAKLISGEWAGTMNLTESRAGSDVGALATRATANGDHHLISGQKIFITYGEHDFTENIVHMVLARMAGAPDGTKGISLFVVPKFLINKDGSLGPKNDLRCVSIEHKLGILASPTAVMAYGDSGGAIGYLVGEENRGMEYMFTMMNNARLAVGIQGVAIAERAYQQAVAYARERVQGRALTGGDPIAIIGHPDVRRTLMIMKAKTEAARAAAYSAAAALDRSKAEPDPVKREAAQTRLDFLIPIVKAWCTDIGCEVASLGIQVHGGMGFIEETGAAQHYRDARILPIYEGTNGIQALDLLLRKLVRDRGSAAADLYNEIETDLRALHADAGTESKVLCGSLTDALATLRTATQSLIDTATEDSNSAAAVATPFLEQVACVVGGWLLAKSALRAEVMMSDGDRDFLASKITTARFYAEHILPQAGALAATVMQGSSSALALKPAQF